MRTVYIDCGMGAAGDMLTAALLELVPNEEEIIEKLNHMGLANVSFTRSDMVKCGIKGSHMSVCIDGKEEDIAEGTGHAHHSMEEIAEVIDGLRVSDNVKQQAKEIYGLIADAESQVHGLPVTEIHFHEVGAYDAIADVVAVCLLMEAIAPEQVVVSPIHVGSGTVTCAHGVLPVPAPATAVLLQGCPIYGGEISGELCTPTGAALLKFFATEFGDMPVMKVNKTGYGMGKKDFERANLVRVMLGQTKGMTDVVTELSCNVDDMTAEEIGFATETFLASGALEVFTIPIGMKKNRPGHLIHVICEREDKEKMLSLIFKHTSTLGIREDEKKRYKLDRKVEAIETSYGTVRKKIASGYGVERYKYEYEDLARIAKENNTSIAEIRKKLEKEC